MDSWFLGQDIQYLKSKNGSHKLTATLYDYTKGGKIKVLSAEC